MSKKANKENRCSRSIFENEIEKLMKDPSVSDMGRFHQHKGNTKLAHVENVADISFKIAEKLHLNIDEKSLARGAMLHDFYMYNATESDIGVYQHITKHPKIALLNAKKHFILDDKAENIIRSHMWPLTLFHPPRSKEAMLVCAADKYCAAREMWDGRKKNTRHRKTENR